MLDLRSRQRSAFRCATFRAAEAEMSVAANCAPGKSFAGAISVASGARPDVGDVQTFAGRAFCLRPARDVAHRQAIERHFDHVLGSRGGESARSGVTSLRFVPQNSCLPVEYVRRRAQRRGSVRSATERLQFLLLRTDSSSSGMRVEPCSVCVRRRCSSKQFRGQREGRYVSASRRRPIPVLDAVRASIARVMPEASARGQ